MFKVFVCVWAVFGISLRKLQWLPINQFFFQLQYPHSRKIVCLLDPKSSSSYCTHTISMTEWVFWTLRHLTFLSSRCLDDLKADVDKKMDDWKYHYKVEDEIGNVGGLAQPCSDAHCHNCKKSMEKAVDVSNNFQGQRKQLNIKSQISVGTFLFLVDCGCWMVLKEWMVV